MEKRTQIEARITESILRNVKKLTFILSNFMYFVVTFKYSFNRNMQTTQKSIFFTENSQFERKIPKILNHKFRWVAFSRFRYESKINFWQINSIFENLVLRAAVQIQQSIDSENCSSFCRWKIQEFHIDFNIVSIDTY